MTAIRLLRMLLTVMVLPMSVLAADLRVEYVVDAKLLKSQTVAGTPLSFAVFTDASCTAPVATEVVNVEAVQRIEYVMSLKPKAAIAGPKTARIQHTLSGAPAAATLYLQVTGTGISPVGGACQLQYASIGGTASSPPASCGPDSASVGDLCVDKYEASVWSIPAANTSLIQQVKDGTVTLASLQGGGATQLGATPGTGNCTGSEYPGSFPTIGEYADPLYAVSVAGVLPSACLSVFQAEAACIFSGKQLISAAPWVRAASATPDTNSDDGATDCNTNAGGSGVHAPVATGSRSACVSAVGIFDLIGNIDEWTAPTLIGNSAWSRGGEWSGGTATGVFCVNEHDSNEGDAATGFRCAR